MTGKGARRSKNVLIVDDQQATRALIKAAVESTEVDCRIMEATDYDSALAAAQEHQPDLVLLDIVLPGSRASSLRICRELCKDTATKVVIVSSQSGPAVQACLGAGAVGYLPKPFSVATLQAKLREWLGG